MKQSDLVSERVLGLTTGGLSLFFGLVMCLAAEDGDAWFAIITFVLMVGSAAGFFLLPATSVESRKKRQ